jgi:hypothetical protein
MHGYAPRFLTATQLVEAVNFYHLARTALSGQADQGKHARKIWASNEAAKLFNVTPTAAYKDLCGALEA